MELAGEDPLSGGGLGPLLAANIDEFLMGKEKTFAAGSLLYEIFQTGVYKRTQGRVTRQTTFGVLAATTLFGAWRLHQYLGPVLGRRVNSYLDSYLYYVFEYGAVGAAGLFVVLGLWFSYRIVNYQRFADFLIAVEAEMNKVSWPTRAELWRSSIVVITVIFALAFVLYFYDIFWVSIFSRVLGIT